MYELSQAVLHLLGVEEGKGHASNMVMEFAFAIRLQRYSKAGTENGFRGEKKMLLLGFVFVMAYLSGVCANI